MPVFEGEDGLTFVLVPGEAEAVRLPWICGDPVASSDPAKSPGGFTRTAQLVAPPKPAQRGASQDQRPLMADLGELVHELGGFPVAATDTTQSTTRTVSPEPRTVRSESPALGKQSPSADRGKEAQGSSTEGPSPASSGAKDEAEPGLAETLGHKAPEMAAESAVSTLTQVLSGNTIDPLGAIAGAVGGQVFSFAAGALKGGPPEDSASTLDWAMATVAPQVATKVFSMGNLAKTFGLQGGPYDGQALRFGDCDEGGNPILQAANSVAIGGRAAAREGDFVATSDVVEWGVKNVLIEGKPAAKAWNGSAKVGSRSAQGKKKFQSGAQNVFIGGVTTRKYDQNSEPPEVPAELSGNFPNSEFKGNHNPNDPAPKEPGFYMQSDGEMRHWDPGNGWSSSLSEQSNLSPWGTFGMSDLVGWFDDGAGSWVEENLALRNLFRASGEPGWLNEALTSLGLPAQQTPGNWYLLGGLIDLGSPVSPGAGTGSTWWVPDTLFGYEMNSYYVPHDWTYRPDDPRLATWSGLLWQLEHVEWATFQAGLGDSVDPLRVILQSIYSTATTLATLATWWDSYMQSINERLGRPDVLGYLAHERHARFAAH
ncbi:MAG: hypothetical protein IT169_11975 [Bryobacterales bacterium]|nr:hypothetical protein [Bryobacterales bacterium]